MAAVEAEAAAGVADVAVVVEAVVEGASPGVIQAHWVDRDGDKGVGVSGRPRSISNFFRGWVGCINFTSQRSA